MFNLIHFLDSRAFDIILNWRIGWLEDVFLIITVLGAWQVAAVIVILAAVYFWRAGARARILVLIVSVAASSVTTFVLKHLIARPRPAGVAVYIEDLSSFPSGHATVAMALYGFAAYLIFKKWFGIKRWLGITISVLVVLLIGFSRIYLGVHYLSDVAGGYLVGGAWLAAGILLTQKVQKQNCDI